MKIPVHRSLITENSIDRINITPQGMNEYYPQEIGLWNLQARTKPQPVSTPAAHMQRTPQL